MFWWILWGILLLLALLLLLPIRLELTYLGGSLTVKARLLWLLRFTLFPLKRRERKPRKVKKKKAAPTQAAPQPPGKKQSLLLMDLLQTINDLLPLLGSSLDYCLRHTTLHRCWVRVRVHQEEAADTGIRCGQLNALGYTLYAWCAARVKLRDFCFNVVPNFVSEEESLNLQLCLSASPGVLLWGLLLLLWKGGWLLFKGPLLESRGKHQKKQPGADRKHRRKPTTKTIKDGVS